MRVFQAVFAATAVIAATTTVVGCPRAEGNDLPFCEESASVIGLDDATSLATRDGRAPRCLPRRRRPLRYGASDR